MNSKKIVSVITSVATVALTTAGAFMPLVAGAAPLNCSAEPFAKSWKTFFGPNSTQSAHNVAVAYYDNNNIYVAGQDYEPPGSFPGSQRYFVKVFNAVGQLQRTFGEFLYPQQQNPINGMVVDSSGNVYLTQFGTTLIKKVDPNGSPLTTWNASADPLGIQFNGGLLHVLGGSPGAITVEKFDTSGVSQGTVAFSGGSLYFAGQFALDQAGNYYFRGADSPQAGVLEKYDSNGAYVAGGVQPPGTFSQLSGAIGVDSNGFVWVSNGNGGAGQYGEGNLRVFDPSLTLVSTIPGHVREPRANLVISPDDVIYLPDNNSGGNDSELQVYDCLSDAADLSLTINSVTQDGGTDLEVSAALTSTEGGTVFGDIRAVCTDSVNVSIGSATNWRDIVSGEGGAYLERPPVTSGSGLGGLKSNPVGHFVFRDNFCTTTTGSFTAKLTDPDNNYACVKSTTTNRLYDLTSLVWRRDDGSFDPNTTYTRVNTALGATSIYSATPPSYAFPASVPLNLTPADIGRSCVLKIDTYDTSGRAFDSKSFTYNGESQIVFGGGGGPGDDDGDGIENSIDLLPTVFSDEFNDADSNNGIILDRSDLTFEITDNIGDGVHIRVFGGGGLAIIETCGGTGILFMVDGEEVDVDCGSSTVKALSTASTIEVRQPFNGNFAAQAKLTQGQKVTLSPFLADAGNATPVIIQVVDVTDPTDPSLDVVLGTCNLSAGRKLDVTFPGGTSVLFTNVGTGTVSCTMDENAFSLNPGKQYLDACPGVPGTVHGCPNNAKVKVPLCHKTGNGFKFMYIQVNALDGHLGHGDSFDLNLCVETASAGNSLVSVLLALASGFGVGIYLKGRKQ